MTFLELAEKVIKEEKRPLSPKEIWEIAKAKSLYDSTGEKPWQIIGAKIYVDIDNKKEDSKFRNDGKRPRRFFLRELDSIGAPQDGTNMKQPPSIKPPRDGVKESDLHQYLAYFAFAHRKVYTKTIHHWNDNKRKFTPWLHPDMVGFYLPVGWESALFEFSSIIGNPAVKLYSFEIKKSLDFSNIRQDYFQAVSNSSWAHEGYLVASKISEEEDFLSELERLSNSFGIGVIELDLKSPNSSKILFPAKNKDILDLDTMNIMTNNGDFKAFLNQVRTDIYAKKVHSGFYDKVPDLKQLI